MRQSSYFPPSVLLDGEVSTVTVWRFQRTWPALLTLLFLAPITGELLSGSTPLLMFINPFSLLFESALYGSGAILVRELVRRRGLGWSSILLLGAAYGILEEGLVVTSWFNPYWPDLGFLAMYGRLWDTSWVWAVELTIFHAIVSITIPIVLVELLFPSIAQHSWLGKRSYRFFVIALASVSLLGLLGFGFLLSRVKGYTHPPVMYLGALLLTVGLVWFGLHFRPRVSRPIHAIAPGLWKLRSLAFATTVAFFFTAWALPHIVSAPVIPILVFAGLVIWGIWLISRWARSAIWNAEHRLALVSGVLGLVILLTPLVEFATHPTGKVTTGQSFVGLACLVALIMLTWRVKRQEQYESAHPSQLEAV